MIVAILFVSTLLVLGVALRLGFSFFQWFYIPGSVIAGLLGLVVIQWGHVQLGTLSKEVAGTLDQWPSWLISVVFAGMLLERKSRPLKEKARDVGREALMVWIIVLGQTGLGLLATWLLILPFYDLPNSFGMLIETGFAGGHGTAAAMGEVFAHESIGLEGGRDLGVLMATVGLVYGVVSGIIWINVAARRGWIRQPKSTPMPNVNASVNVDVTGRPIGYAKVSGETIDPLLLQAVWLMIALGIGYALQQSVLAVAGMIDTMWAAEVSQNAAESQLSQRLTFTRVLNFPLFIYTLFGGAIVRRGTRLCRCEHLIDGESIHRLTAAAMDVLVVAAIASLNLSTIITLAVPLAILILVGAIWTGVCLLVISRWLLPKDYWFELGLINYGMSTGVTATGFVLLRMVDPELESEAAEDYALAAPFSAPFVGGGMITIGLPLLALEIIPIAASAITILSIVIVLTALGRRIR